MPGRVTWVRVLYVGELPGWLFFTWESYLVGCVIPETVTWVGVLYLGELPG